jgi:4-hydroxythreonine-4-phosphate dehydrogenase
VRSLKPVWAGRASVADPRPVACFAEALPVVERGRRRRSPGLPISTAPGCARFARNSRRPDQERRRGCALVTGPVSKAQLYAVGFTHPGQTEFVAERCGVASDLIAMMLVGPGLRTVPVTVHVPLRSVPDALTADRIVAKGRAAARGLQRQFGIEQPRIAVSGLNPHAGEDGTIGREEIDVVAPAIERLRAEGIDASGPFPADTLFHERVRARYDVALCMYHDQALVPIKTLYFDEGVNMTLGLPIVRTSPDHGTAFQHRGQGSSQSRRNDRRHTDRCRFGTSNCERALVSAIGVGLST